MDSLDISGYGTLSSAYAASSSTSTSSTSSSKNSSLDMSDFLKLMAAQFQNQNLDSNTDNTEYITELAQFSSIQAMTTLTQNFNKQYAASLIGKTVTVTDTSSSGITSVHSGAVQGATFDSSGNCTITIGGAAYDLSDVTSVAQTSDSSASGSGSGTAT